MKLKAQGKLKFYCAPCRKQCRDGHGFSQHCETLKHLEKMKEFSENPDKFLNEWSEEFEAGFLKVLRDLKVSGQSVSTKKIYSKFLSDPGNTKITATRWDHIDSFLREMKEKGKLFEDEQGELSEELSEKKNEREEREEDLGEKAAKRAKSLGLWKEAPKSTVRIDDRMVKLQIKGVVKAAPVKTVQAETIAGLFMEDEEDEEDGEDYPPS